MIRRLGLALVLAGLTVVAGCHRPQFMGGKPPAPTGQVVAVVEGQEITVRDLDEELAGLNITDPKLRKLAQDRALQSIIIRKILAKAALDQGLDKSADFALAKQRADESLLAQALETKLVTEVPAPTRDEAAHFVSSHADMFEQRKILTVDQIRFTRPANQTVLQELVPLHTMADIKALLDKEHVPYQEGPSQLDTAVLGPDLSTKILQLPPNEVFIIPGGGGTVLLNQIQNSTTQPLTDDQSIQVAMAYLRRQHAEEALSRSISPIVQKGVSTVAYNAAYRPTAPASGSPASNSTASNTVAPAPASNAH